MGRQRSITFPAHDESLAPRNDEQMSIRQEIDAKGQKKRDADEDLALAARVDGNNLLGAPVRKPEAVLAPTRRLTHRKTSHQSSQFRPRGLRCRHGNLLDRSACGVVPKGDAPASLSARCGQV